MMSMRSPGQSEVIWMALATLETVLCMYKTTQNDRNADSVSVACGSFSEMISRGKRFVLRDDFHWLASIKHVRRIVGILDPPSTGVMQSGPKIA